MSTQDQLIKQFDALDADLGKLLAHYRKVKRDRKALLDVATDARNLLAKHLRSRTMTRADFEFLHNSLTAAILQAQAESEGQ
jgi:hypothetical protein